MSISYEEGEALAERGRGMTDDTPGMSLRDYFAGQTLEALLAKLPVVDQEGEFGMCVEDKIKYNNDIASSAYAIADAMVKAREK